MDEEDLELEFISGRFLEDPLPKEKTWLLKYFRREREQQFVKYFLIFNNYWHFVDQTGYYFCIKNLNLLLKRNWRCMKMNGNPLKISNIFQQIWRFLSSH